MPSRHAPAQLYHFHDLFNDDVSNSEQQGIGEYVPQKTWKGSGRSLLELPSGRDTAQHSRPAGEHATATFLANFVSISYHCYAGCM